MNILFNNIKKEMEKKKLDKKELEKKPIEIIKTNLDKINNDLECIRKDIQAIYALIDLKEKQKNLEKDSMWFFT